MASGTGEFEDALQDLIKLGDDVKLYFHIEKCDPYGGKFSYLNTIPEDEWDEEDRAVAKEYEKLKEKIETIHANLKKLGALSSTYQKFYTQGIRVISTIAPERLSDFENQYRRKTGSLKSIVDYTISDGFRGIQQVGGAYSPTTALGLIQNQIDIIIAIKESLGSILFEVEQTLRMDLFDSEIESAKHLRERGHLRAAGAVLGVVLEEHLKATSARHGFQTRKKGPSISDYNEYLKAEGIIDTIAWRRIQGLADIRNLCDHSKDREPTPDDLDDLLAGVDRTLKTVL
jgi:hypothetical protein